MGDTHMKSNIEERAGANRNLTFVVTEFCNLACKYCYEVKKNNKCKMSFEVAKKAIDLILDKYHKESGITFEFIGGEPLLEIDLIDKICDYIKLELYRRNDPWFNSYTFSITTNGTLYSEPRVQKFISKNKNKLSITISLDGNEQKHNMQRVKLDGSGSYDDVVKNVNLWLSQFPNANTKVTFASDDLKYLKDSIIHLWNLGIKNVPANVVYEDVWKDGDDKIFEQQIKELADYIIDNNISNEYNCGLFDETAGFPLSKAKERNNWCSSGDRMLAVDHKGDFYPCIRFLPLCLEKRKPLLLGNVDEGINEDLLRVFEAVSYSSQTNDECGNCDQAGGCGWCQGHNYDYADSDTIYQRATYICKMHKARCRGNDYFYARLKNEQGYKRKTKKIDRNKFLFFIMSNKSVPFCNYKNEYIANDKMKLDDFARGIAYAKENFLVPVIVHDEDELPQEFANELRYIEVKHIRPYNSKITYNDELVVHDQIIDELDVVKNTVLLVDNDNIKELTKTVKKMFCGTDRISIVLQAHTELNEYEIKQYEIVLQEISDVIFHYYQDGIIKQFNVLTDILMSKKMINCNAGTNSLTLAPNGQIYLCPAFYYKDTGSHIGDLMNGFKIVNPQLLKLEKSPICINCDSFHCKRCIFSNKYKTREFNIPSANQCKISHIERRVSKALQDKILSYGKKSPFTINILKDVDYDDPISIVRKQKSYR